MKTDSLETIAARYGSGELTTAQYLANLAIRYAKATDPREMVYIRRRYMRVRACS